MFLFGQVPGDTDAVASGLLGTIDGGIGALQDRGLVGNIRIGYPEAARYTRHQAARLHLALNLIPQPIRQMRRAAAVGAADQEGKAASVEAANGIFTAELAE